MKHILKKFGLSVIMALQLMTLTLPAHAQLFNSTAGTGVNPMRCARDYVTFLSSVIGYDDFIEYWKDILVRYSSNICQYQDIETLRQRIVKVREQIRKAFYVCADTTKMKDSYYKLEAELSYVRKFINVNNGSFYSTPDDEVLKDLRSYLGDHYGDDQIMEFFEGFKQKYGAKLDGYKNCKDPGWEQLTLKWKEFTETMAGLGPSITQAGADIEKHWKRMANTPLNLGRDFIGGFLDARVNGLSPKLGLEQIKAEFEKNSPQGYTFSELQAATQLESQRYDGQKLEQDFLTQYQSLYGETKDVFTGEILDRMDLLNKIIIATYPYVNQTTQCVKSIKDKQC
ncbi:hypothetical protein IT413_03880 [Candidatus Peregrinibacteria bacterium]|nr:hypothetical protein [Candidatus Peregrinibacteria bacterium]